ncbi:RNA recognition motif domain [Trinorchestia longiramus]|nr:RNA recognition motif domain [Trinorchestia longiramus]
MGDYFEEEMDTGPDTAGIVIDDYDGYDEEYFEDDAGTFSQEDQENEKPVKVGATSSDRLAGRLSVDTPSCSAGAPGDSAAGSAYHKDKAATDTVTEEVEEIEEEVIEEEEEEEDEEYERFNRTEVADSRSSVLNRLGPRLGGVTGAASPSTTAKPDHQAAAAVPPTGGGSGGRSFPSEQCIGIAKRLLFVSNLPPTVTAHQVMAHLRCLLTGRVNIELFDGVYNGCCVVGLSSAGAVRPVMASIAKTPFIGRKIFAKQMQVPEHEMFLKYKMATPPSPDTDQNALWVVVMHNVNLATTEVLLRTAILQEVPALLNLQLIRSNKNKGNQLALAVAPSKQVADHVSEAWSERVVDGHQLKTCPLYRGYKRAGSSAPKPPLVCSRSDESSKAVGAQKSEAEQKAAGGASGGGKKTVPCTTIKMNNMHELLRHTKGCACRVNVFNVAYSATEDDVIEAVNAKVGGLQYILPFRNNQGCFNGNMLLEFVTPAAAKKFFTVMQKFVLKQRQIFLRMLTRSTFHLHESRSVFCWLEFAQPTEVGVVCGAQLTVSLQCLVNYV